MTPSEWTTRLEARVREWRSAPLPSPSPVAETSAKAPPDTSTADIATLFREALVCAPCLEVATIYVAWQLESIDRSALAAADATTSTSRMQNSKGVAAAAELVHAKKTRVYEAALQHVGGDVHALPLWRSYLAHLGRSTLGFARALDTSGGSGGGDRSKISSPEHSRRMEAAFARALAVPIAAAHKLWDDYYAWHRAASDVRGPAVERDTRRQRARMIALGETRRRIYAETKATTTTTTTSTSRSAADASDERVRVWRGWRAAIAFERARKYQVARDDWRRAMRLVHKQAAAAAAQSEYPDYWCARLCWTVEYHATGADHHARQHARYLSLVHKFDARRHFASPAAVASSSSSSSSSSSIGARSDDARRGRSSSRRRDDRDHNHDDDEEEEDDADALRAELGRKFEAHHDADDVHAYESELDDGVDTRLEDSDEDARVTPLNLHLHLARHAHSSELAHECVELFREAWRSCLPRDRCDDIPKSAAHSWSSSSAPTHASADGLARTANGSETKSDTSLRAPSASECASRPGQVSAAAAKNVLTWVCVQWSEFDEILRLARHDDAQPSSLSGGGGGDRESELLVASRLYRDAWRHTRRAALVEHQAWREWRATRSLSHVLAATCATQSDANHDDGSGNGADGKRAPEVATNGGGGGRDGDGDGNGKEATRRSNAAALVLLEIVSHHSLRNRDSRHPEALTDEPPAVVAAATATVGEQRGATMCAADRLYETTLRECATARKKAQVMRRWCADLEARDRYAEILRLCVRHTTLFGAESRRIALRAASLTQSLSAYRDTVRHLFASDNRGRVAAAGAAEDNGGDGGAIVVRPSDDSTYAVARAFSATVAACPELYSRDYRRFLARALAANAVVVALAATTPGACGIDAAATMTSGSSRLGVVASPLAPALASSISAESRSNPTSIPPPPLRSGEWTTWVAPVAVFNRSSSSPPPPPPPPRSVRQLGAFNPRDFRRSPSPPSPMPPAPQVARARDAAREFARHSATSAPLRDGERDRDGPRRDRERRQRRNPSPPTDRRAFANDAKLGSETERGRAERSDAYVRRRHDEYNAERGRRPSDRDTQDAGQTSHRQDPRRSEDDEKLLRLRQVRATATATTTMPMPSLPAVAPELACPVFPTDLLRQRTEATRERSSGVAVTSTVSALVAVSAAPSPNRKRKVAGKEDANELRPVGATAGFDEVAAKRARPDAPPASVGDARKRGDEARNVTESTPTVRALAPKKPLRSILKRGAAVSLPLPPAPSRNASSGPTAPLTTTTALSIPSVTPIASLTPAAAAAVGTMTARPKAVAASDAPPSTDGVRRVDLLPPTPSSAGERRPSIPRRQLPPKSGAPTPKKQAATVASAKPTRPPAPPPPPAVVVVVVAAVTDAVTSRREKTGDRGALSRVDMDKMRVKAKKSPAKKTTVKAASAPSRFLPPPPPPPQR